MSNPAALVQSAQDFGKILPPTVEQFVQSLDIAPSDADEPFSVFLDARGFMWARVADLRNDPENAKDHKKNSIEAIARSLENYGQQKPVVVNRRTRIVYAGNGSLLAAALINWEYLRISPTDLSGAEAMAYALDDNRTAEYAKWDWAKVAAQLQGLKAGGMDLARLSFEQFEVEPLLRVAWAAPTAENSTDANVAPKTSKKQADPVAEKATRCLLELTGGTLERFNLACERLRVACENAALTQAQCFDLLLGEWTKLQDQEAAEAEAAEAAEAEG